MIQLFATAGERTENGSDDHVSSITFEHAVGELFRVTDFGCFSFLDEEFVKLDLFLRKGRWR